MSRSITSSGSAVSGSMGEAFITRTDPLGRVLQGGANGNFRHFPLDHDDRRIERGYRLRHVRGSHAQIGALRHGDRVGAGAVHGNHRGAGCGFGGSGDVVGVHAGGCQRLQKLVACIVLTNGADHGHLRAGARRRDGLIGPLAAGIAAKPPAVHGLTGARYARDAHDDVQVDAADDDHAAHLAARLVLGSRTSRTASAAKTGKTRMRRQRDGCRHSR